MNEILFDIKKSQLKMVQARGYDIGGESVIFKMKYDEFYNYLDNAIAESLKLSSDKTLIVNELDILSKVYYTPENVNPKKSILVYYSNVKTEKKDSIPVKVITAFNKKSLNKNESIFITDGIMSKSNIKDFDSVIGTDWQFFNIKELTYVPVEHQYSPRYQRLTNDEADSKLLELGTNRAMMPIMALKGPISKYFNYKLGDIIKIYRDDYSIGIQTPESINYRVVLNVSK